MALRSLRILAPAGSFLRISGALPSQLRSVQALSLAKTTSSWSRSWLLAERVLGNLLRGIAAPCPLRFLLISRLASLLRQVLGSKPRAILWGVRSISSLLRNWRCRLPMRLCLLRRPRPRENIPSRRCLAPKVLSRTRPSRCLLRVLGSILALRLLRAWASGRLGLWERFQTQGREAVSRRRWPRLESSSLGRSSHEAL